MAAGVGPPVGRDVAGHGRVTTAVPDVAPGALPLALWACHRELPVGAALRLAARTLAAPTGPRARRPAGGAWPADLLAHVVTGAGFTVEGRSHGGDAGDARDAAVRWMLRRERTLADTVRPGLRLLLVGLNPSEYAADAGVGFARPGNRAWPALLAAGLATVDRDPLHLCRAHRVGMTDLAKRATPRAEQLDDAELVAGLARLDALCAWLRPGAVCVLGVTGWRTATGERRAGTGWQARGVGGRPAYVMPNPSGLNAHSSVDDLTAHLLAAAAGPAA